MHRLGPPGYSGSFHRDDSGIPDVPLYRINKEHAVETTRLRFMANAYLASGCMFTMGVVFAPLLRYWRWMAWPTLALLLIAGLFGWRAYRLWGQWLAEVAARDDDKGTDPT